MFINFRTPGVLPVGSVTAAAKAGRITSPKLEVGEARQGMRAFRQALSKLDELERLIGNLGPRELVETSTPLSLDLATGAHVSEMSSDGKVSAATQFDQLRATSTSPVNDPPGQEELSPGFLLTLSGTYDGLDDVVMQVEQRDDWTSVDGSEIDGNRRNLRYDLTVDGASAGTARFRRGRPPGTTRSFGGGIDATIDVQSGYASGLARGQVQWSFDVQATRIDTTQALSDADFADGAVVSSGTFELNGATIDVDASDSLDVVMARIEASDAGVTARFDTATQQLVLEGAEEGPTDIELANDTSGIIRALKLDDARVTVGSQGDVDRNIEDVEGLAFVESGNFFVGDARVRVNVSRHSLRDVIDRINTAVGTEVASFDATRKQVVLSGAGPATDGTSNFATTVLATAPVTREPSRLIGKIERTMEDLSKQLKVVDSVFGGEVSANLKDALRERLGVGDDVTGIRSRLGMRFDFGSESQRGVMGVRDGVGGLRRTLRSRSGDFRRFLLGRGAGDEGLVDTLRQTLVDSAKTMATKHGVTGLSVYA